MNKAQSVASPVVQGGDDPILTYMSLIASHHTTHLDRSYVESVFDSYSSTPTGLSQVDDSDEQKVITKGNAILAYEEIFKMWKVDLNLQ